MLLTWRSESIPASHSLRQLVSEMQRSRHLHRVTLERLDRDAVELLVTAAQIDKTIDRAELAAHLDREAEGLPLFIVEYLDLIAAGKHSAQADNWQLPATISELLRARLSNVSEMEQQLLATAAVIGRSFDFDVLSAVSGRSEDESVSALEALTARGLIRESDSTNTDVITYDFYHEQFRGLVYHEMNAARRRLLHRRVAEALHTIARRVGQDLGELSGQLAQHWELGGAPEQAAEYYALAGGHSRTLHANQAALAQFQKALALGRTDRAALHTAIADLHTLSGDYAAARRSYETAAALADEGELAEIEYALGRLCNRLGEWDAAEASFAEALERSADPQSQARIYADWSLSAFQNGDADRARQLAGDSLQQAILADDISALAQSHNIVGILSRRDGRLDRAIDHGESSLAAADAFDDLAAA
ncbi:MAG: tetratricopeptide repeat protein, partial [Caldilineaceae bacterium]|nr:tetratricopeptide repeat protein [Caldilineaceae bacterium]